MRIDDIEIGSRWYVQLAPRATLVERQVVEKTELTIVLKDPHSLSSCNKARYRFDELVFVESC